MPKRNVLPLLQINARKFWRVANILEQQKHEAQDEQFGYSLDMSYSVRPIALEHYLASFLFYFHPWSLEVEPWVSRWTFSPSLSAQTMARRKKHSPHGWGGGSGELDLIHKKTSLKVHYEKLPSEF